MRSRISCLIFIATFGFVGLCCATTLVEDFNGYTNGQLDGQGVTGGGWSGAWGSGEGTTGRIIESTASNLTYSGGGYNITQTGTGLAYGNYGDGNGFISSFRGSNRIIASPMTGTVWFSALVSDTDPSGHTGLSFNSDVNPVSNSTNIDYDVTPFRIDLAGTTANLYFGSTTTATSTAAGPYTVGNTHLLVGSLTVGTGTDTISVWIDPTDLSNLGAANLSASADLGDTLARFGFFAYGDTDVQGSGGTHGKVDALRLSDGNGNAAAAFTAVTGVIAAPEPSKAVFGLFGMLAILLQRRKRAALQA